MLKASSDTPTEFRQSLAVVLVNYRGAQDVCEISSALLKNCPCATIVVVHNDSDDWDELQRCVVPLGAKVLRSASNVGFARAVNLGLSYVLTETKVPYVLLLNPDTQIDGNTLPRLVAALDADSHAGMSVPRIMTDTSPPRVWYGGGDVTWLRGRISAHDWMKSESEMTTSRESGYTEFATGCAMLCRRELFERIGSLDPRLFMYEEDVDLSIRAIKAGMRIRYVPEAVVLHRVHGSVRERGEELVPAEHWSNPNASFYVFHILKNKLLVFSKHLRGVRRLLFITVISMEYAFRACGFLRHGKFDAVRAIPRAVRSAWRDRRLPDQESLERRVDLVT